MEAIRVSFARPSRLELGHVVTPRVREDKRCHAVCPGGEDRRLGNPDRCPAHRTRRDVVRGHFSPRTQPHPCARQLWRVSAGDPRAACPLRVGEEHVGTARTTLSRRRSRVSGGGLARLEVPRRRGQKQPESLPGDKPARRGVCAEGRGVIDSEGAALGRGGGESVSGTLLGWLTTHVLRESRGHSSWSVQTNVRLVNMHQESVAVTRGGGGGLVTGKDEASHGETGSFPVMSDKSTA